MARPSSSQSSDPSTVKAVPVATARGAQRTSARRFFAIISVLGALLVLAAAALWRREPTALLWTALGCFGYELGLNGLLVSAAWFGLRAKERG